MKDSYIGSSLAGHPSVEIVQAALKGLNSDPDIQWTPAQTWHVTYVYMPNGELPVIHADDDMMLVSVRGLDCWKTEDGNYATVILLDPQQLSAFQAKMLAFCKEFEVSEFHLKNFKPHITVAYSKNPTRLPASIELSILPITNVELRNRVMVAQHIDLGAMKVMSRVLARSEEGDHTRMTFSGLPYKGQVDGYDFHNTFFSRRTDIGDLSMQTPIKLYFDHGRFTVPYNGTVIGPGTSILGRAFVGDEDPEIGRLIEVLVDRRTKYHDMLMTLDKMDILRGSAQAIASMYDVDFNTGEITKFHLGEFSGTVTPSNEYNRPYDAVRSIILRSVSVEENENNAPGTPPEATPDETRHVDQVSAILDEAKNLARTTAEDQAKLAAAQQQQTMADLVRSIEAMRAEIADLKAAQVNIAETVRDTMKKNNEDLARAFDVAAADAATMTAEEAILRGRSSTTTPNQRRTIKPGSLAFGGN